MPPLASICFVRMKFHLFPETIERQLIIIFGTTYYALLFACVCMIVIFIPILEMIFCVFSKVIVELIIISNKNYSLLTYTYGVRLYMKCRHRNRHRHRSRIHIERLTHKDGPALICINLR